MGAQLGQVYRDSAFYLDAESGELKSKYFLVLAAPVKSDIVIRLLTSRYEGLRPEMPACFHGDPYPGYFLGILGHPLSRKSWLDLRKTSDLDPWDFARHLSDGRIQSICSLANSQLKPALDCAANADDTTKLQERWIRDVLSGLP